MSNHKFHGGEYRRDHFVTPRRIEGFYPRNGYDKNVFMGRCALLAALLTLLAVIAWAM